MLLLKIPKFSELRRLESRKKRIIIKVVPNIKRGILSAFLATYEDVFAGINVKRYCGLSFEKIL